MRMTRGTWALIGWALLIFGGWAHQAHAQDLLSKDVGQSTYLVPVFPGAQVNVFPFMGTFRYTLPLFKTSGVGPCSSFTLTYDTINFDYAIPSAIQVGWQCNYNMRISASSPSSIDLHLPWNGTPLGFQGTGGSTTFNVSPGFGFSAQITTGAGTISGQAYQWAMQVTGGNTYYFRTHGTNPNGSSDGSLMSIVDPVGNRTDILNMDYLRPTQIVDMIPPGAPFGGGGLGRTTTVEYYDASVPTLLGKMKAVVDPAGNRYDFVYTAGSAGQQLTSVLFPPVVIGGVSQRPNHKFVYYQDASGFMSQVIPPRGAVNGDYSYGITYGDTSSGAFHKVIKITDPFESYMKDDGSTGSTPTIVTFKYFDNVLFNSVQQFNTIVTDRRGYQTGYVFKTSATGTMSSLLSEIWDPVMLSGAPPPGIFPVLTCFDPNYNLISLVDKFSNITNYTFVPPAGPLGDFQKNLLQSVTKPGPSGPIVTESFTYTQDIFSGVRTHTTTTDAGVSRTTVNDYDSFGRLTTIHHPDVTSLPNAPAQTGIITRYVYDTADPRKPLKQIINERGNANTFQSFDSRHGLPQQEVSDGGSQPSEKRYDIMGNVIQAKLPQGQSVNDAPDWVLYHLDSHFRVDLVTETFNGSSVTKLAYEFDLDGNKKSALQAGDATTPAQAEIYSYDRRGMLTSVAGPDGTATQTFDANGNVRVKTSLRTYPTTFKYDSLNRKTEVSTFGTSVIGAGGGGGPEIKTTYQYDLGGQVGNTYDLETRVGISSASRQSKTYYDNHRRVREIQLPDGHTSVRFKYDLQDQLVAKETWFDGLVQKAEVTFRDERDRVYRQRVQPEAYSAGVNPSVSSDVVTIRNAAGTVVEVRDPLWSAASPASHRLQFGVDLRERVVSTYDGFGVEIKRNLYGDDDKLIEVQVPDPATKSTALVTSATYRYTSRKELREIYNRDNIRTTQNTYRVREGVIASTKDAAGVITQNTYYPNTWHLNEVIIAPSQPDERRVKSVWTTLGGLLAQTQVWDSSTGTVNGAIYKYTYDRADRVELFEYPGAILAPEQRYYSEFSEPFQVKAQNRVCTYTYDLLGRLTSSAWTGPATETFTQTYDQLGNPTSIYSTVPPDPTIRKSVAATFATRKWLGTPDSTTYAILGVPWQGSSPTLTYTYDLNRHLTATTDKEGGRHAWTYDANNRLQSTAYAPGLPVKTVWAVTYTPGDLISTTTLHNASGAPIATTTFTYDGRGRKIRQQTVNLASHAVLSDLKWNYDDRDLITKITWLHLGADSTIGYNSRREVISENITSNGNGLTPPPFSNTLVPGTQGSESSGTGPATARTAAALSIAARNATYVVDAAGNRTSQTIVAGNTVSTTFTYNSASQLKTELIASSQSDKITHNYDLWGNESSRTTDLQNNGTVETTENYQYNALSRLSVYTNSTTAANWQYDCWPNGDRSTKTDNTTGTKEHYILKSEDVIADYQQVGTGTITLKNKYVQGITTDSKQLRIASDGSRRFFIDDSVGTLGMTLDDAAAVQQSSFKDTFGVQLAGSTSQERYSGLAQRERDTESGLDYVRARMYDPRTGRFTQTDPVFANRAVEHYIYCSGNPTSIVDPLGLAGLTERQKQLIKQFPDMAEQILADANKPEQKGDGKAQNEFVWKSKAPVLPKQWLDDPDGLTVTTTKDGTKVYQYKDRTTRAAEFLIEQGAIAAVTAGLGSGFLVAEEVVEGVSLVRNGLKAQKPLTTLERNVAAGKAWEEEGTNIVRQTQTNLREQVSIRPRLDNGEFADYRVRLDTVGKDQSAAVKLTDFKASETAPLTKNQAPGYKLIEKNGGKVVGKKGGTDYPAGTVLPPTKVDIMVKPATP